MIKNNKITAPSWYAINVSNRNIDKTIADIKDLNTKRILKIINLADVFAESKIKSRTIFIHAYLTNRLKTALLSIEGVKFFIPKNSSPYTFNDLEHFLKFHFSKEQVAELRQKYLHSHESESVSNLIQEESGKKAKSKNIYNIGDTVMINKGVFKEYCGVITDIEDEIIKVELQMNNSRANISTSTHFSDTELIKN